MKKGFYVGFLTLMMFAMLLLASCGSNSPTPQSDASQESATQYISKEDLKADIDAGSNGYIILDVRKAADYDIEHIKGAYLGDVDPSVSETDNATSTANLKAAIKAATGNETGDSGSKFVLVCYSGKKYAAAATGLMTDMGIPASNIYTLEGGNNGWKEAGDDYIALMQAGADSTDAASSAGDSCDDTEDASAVSKLLSADDLEKLISTGNVKIFDLRSAEDFEKGHIPGAMNIGNKQFEDPDNAVDGEIATVEQFEALMSSYGVSASDVIVAYSNAKSPQMAPRLLWTLEVYGHTDTYILDGHYQRWEGEGKQIEAGPTPNATATEYKVQGVDNSINVAKDAVINKAGNTVLLDVRPVEEYKGEKVADGNARGGHIPGALNVYYMDTVDDNGFFRDAAYLKTLYSDAGITSGQEIIVYCQRGHRASHTWFVLTHILGFENVKVYDGSMMEWSNLEELPIAEGADPGNM